METTSLCSLKIDYKSDFKQSIDLILKQSMDNGYHHKWKDYMRDWNTHEDGNGGVPKEEVNEITIVVFLLNFPKLVISQEAYVI